MEEKIFQQGESIFLPINEETDKKCYEINNITNWAESFYNLKSGVILQRYKKIMSKSEYSQFFEALNYEYGINNCPLDTNTALKIYKTAADKSTDTLSMFRLYRIYKKDYKKFNIKKRNNVLEKFYIMKCFSYLTARKNDNFLLGGRFDIFKECRNVILDDKGETNPWYSEFIDFLYKNYEIYNINSDDITLIDAVFEKNSIILNKLEEKGNPEAIYNLCILNKFEGKYFYTDRYEKLYKMNYYRCFPDYVKKLDYGIESLNIIKKSLLHGYYNHIKLYREIFLMVNDFENIFKSPELKKELMFIIGCMIDAIIADELDVFLDYIYMRKIVIKHFNCKNEFKKNFDFYTKELLLYLIKFTKGIDDENKKTVIKYYINKNYFSEFYIKLGGMYYYGVSDIIERNLDAAINIVQYMIDNKDFFLGQTYNYLLIYWAKITKRKLAKNSKKKQTKKNKNIINKNDKDLLELEKKLLDIHYEKFYDEDTTLYPPSHFYNLSKFYSSNSMISRNHDPILEYVLLFRAANAPLLRLEDVKYDYFKEKYIIYKTKKKLADKDKNQEFQKLIDNKGVINVEGYGDDGTICPICMDKKKSTICLPCKHFFCEICIEKLLEKASCPICRGEIKIIFDINLKSERIIKPMINIDIGDNSSFSFGSGRHSLDLQSMDLISIEDEEDEQDE